MCSNQTATQNCSLHPRREVHGTCSVNERWLACCSLALKERNKKRGPEEKSPEPPYAVDNLMD